MGASPRHTRRMLAAYREQGAATLVHGHRGRKPPNSTPEAVIADVPHLAQTRYVGANHAHLNELLGETGRNPHWPDRPATHPREGRNEQSAAKASAQAPGTPSADA